MKLQITRALACASAQPALSGFPQFPKSIAST
jgi:hypothetical protein